MGADGTRETVQRVAALEHRYQSSARMLTGELDHHVSEIGEVLIGEGELAERIASARVEAGGGHHQLRLEALRGGYEHVTKHTQNLLAARARRERPIENQAPALAGAGLVGAAGSWIPRVQVRVEE